MSIKITARYCITMEDASGTIYSTYNVDNLEDAVKIASNFYDRTRNYCNYLEWIQFRKCACVCIMKRDDNGDYNSIASFTR